MSTGQSLPEKQSALSLVPECDQALLLRVASARVAENTLDVQYYLWEDDISGRLLLFRLLEAARRGVKVRVLLDHIPQLTRTPRWAQLDAHPNVAVRLFNPLRGRFKHPLQWLKHAPQLNHRMHNKAWIVDQQYALVGGRNIGDHYFGIDPVSHFRDLDIYARGPIVSDVSAAFEKFWQSSLSLPLVRISRRQPKQADNLWQRLCQWRSTLPGYPQRFEKPLAFYQGVLKEEDARTVAAPCALLFDLPDKPLHPESLLMGEQLVALLERKNIDELLLEASYFMPGTELIESFTALRQHGVRVAVLTNSLATNDVLLAHAGYSRYRQAVLDAGVALHELRSFPRHSRSRRRQRTSASLHTKAMVMDRQECFVGSFNLDPRSMHVNTEMGIYFLSTELGAALAALIEEGLSPENSYRLNNAPHRGLTWAAVDQRDTRHIAHFDKDPVSPWLKRTGAYWLSKLPLERWI